MPPGEEASGEHETRGLTSQVVERRLTTQTCRSSRRKADVGDRGAGDVAAQPFEFLALMRATAHPGMQAKAMRLDAQRRRGCTKARVMSAQGRFGSSAVGRSETDAFADGDVAANVYIQDERGP